MTYKDKGSYESSPPCSVNKMLYCKRGILQCGIEYVRQYMGSQCEGQRTYPISKDNIEHVPIQHALSSKVIFRKRAL